MKVWKRCRKSVYGLGKVSVAKASIKYIFLRITCSYIFCLYVRTTLRNIIEVNIWRYLLLLPMQFNVWYFFLQLAVTSKDLLSFVTPVSQTLKWWCVAINTGLGAFTAGAMTSVELGLQYVVVYLSLNTGVESACAAGTRAGTQEGCRWLMCQEHSASPLVRSTSVFHMSGTILWITCQEHYCVTIVNKLPFTTWLEHPCAVRVGHKQPWTANEQPWTAGKQP